MKKFNSDLSFKSITVVSIVALSLISMGFMLPQVIAEHGEVTGITKPLDADATNIVSFRDTTNLMMHSLTVSVDTSAIKAGFITIIVQEEDANLDTTAIDVILSSATSTSSELEEPPGLAFTVMPETGPDTGVFSGTINIKRSGPSEGNNLQLQPDNDITILYQNHSAAGRLTAELTTTPTGDGIFYN